MPSQPRYATPIPAGSTQAVFPNNSTQMGLQTGTVAGTITLTPSFVSDGGIVLTVRGQHAAELHVRSRVVGVQHNQLAHDLLGLGIAMASHVDIGHAGQRIGGRGIDGEGLFVLLFGIGKAVQAFEDRAGRKMWFRVLGI